MVKNYLIILCSIIVLGVLFLFLNNKLEGRREEKTDSTTKPKIAPTQEFISNDSRVVISIPTSWHVVDTTPKATNGQFGPYVQSWTVTNYVLKDEPSNTVSDNNVKIDFEIQQGGGGLSLDSLLDCTTDTCETVGIDNEQFIKRTSTSNIGVKTIEVATFYDQNILKVSANIMPGSKQNENIATAEKILQSISFNQKAN